MQKKSVTIVIPVYNEEKSLVELHQKLQNALQKNYSLEYIYVDDASEDTSFEILKKLKASTENATVILIRLRKHMGKSAGLAVGFAKSSGRIVVTIDADLQDDPFEIPNLINKLSAGYDVVSGWRLNREDEAQKIVLSRFFNAFVSTVTGIKLHDFNTGLKAYTHTVVKEITVYGELHRYIPVLAVAKGFKVTEVPVIHHKRPYGKSKYGMGRVFQAGFDFLSTWFLISFKDRPMQLFGMTGATATILGLIVLTYLSYLHFMNQSIGGRPLLIFGVLLVLFGVQLISTGLLAELLTSYNHDKHAYPIDEIIT